MRTRPALLAVLVAVVGVVLLGTGWLLLQPTATGIGRVPAPISVPAPTSLPPPTAPTEAVPSDTAPVTPTDVVPPPPLDDDDDDDGDTDDPDDVDDDGED